MTVDWIRQRIQQYASRGVLLDTNLLLLYLIGSFDRAHVERFKRTKVYSLEDFDLLTSVVQQFHRLVTTPNILTEVSNLAGQLGEPKKSQYFRAFSLEIDKLAEVYVESRAVSQSDHFPQLGLADAVTMSFVDRPFLIMTDDLALYIRLEAQGVEAINFSHIRPLGWS